jgi:alanine dehydrogenase
MPGAVPRTSTYALTNETLPYVTRIADGGVSGAVGRDAGLAEGINVFGGLVTNAGVAEAHGMGYTPVAEVLAG